MRWSTTHWKRVDNRICTMLGIRSYVVKIFESHNLRITKSSNHTIFESHNLRFSLRKHQYNGRYYQMKIEDFVIENCVIRGFCDRRFCDSKILNTSPFTGYFDYVFQVESRSRLYQKGTCFMILYSLLDFLDQKVLCLGTSWNSALHFRVD
jgi:hypothetical protein